jgi:hypothetical protein
MPIQAVRTAEPLQESIGAVWSARSGRLRSAAAADEHEEIRVIEIDPQALRRSSAVGASSGLSVDAFSK